MAKLTRCPTCGKRFEDIGEGWRVIMGCPKCGLRQEDAEKVITHRKEIEHKTQPQPEPEPEPVEKVDADREWMKRLTLKMAKEHGINLRVTWGSAGSWCRPSHKGHPHRIHYGAESIHRDRDIGFCEYISWGHELWSRLSSTKTVRKHTGWTRSGRPSYSSWIKTDLTGRRGLWAQVLHEFAHTEGHYHDNTWAAKVKELQVLYPFEECMNI